MMKGEKLVGRRPTRKEKLKNWYWS